MFGGTFDPIHNAHIEIGRAALTHARLDEVLFVVAARPPHKEGGSFATAGQRLAMVQAALAPLPRMKASGIELERGGPSFTTDTLDELSRLYAGAEVFLIIGFDSLVDLPNWKEPDRILSRARLLVAARPGAPARVPEQLSDRYEMLPGDGTDVSSTEIRRRIARRQDIAHLVPAPAAQIIAEEAIYRAILPDSAGR